MGSYSHDGVYMAVGVVANQIAMVEPDDVLRLEEILQEFFQLLTIERLVAMRRQEALGGGEDGALAVALDATAFEHKSLMVVDRTVLESSLIIQVLRDGIVFLPTELFSPSIKLEVEEGERHHVA